MRRRAKICLLLPVLLAFGHARPVVAAPSRQAGDSSRPDPAAIFQRGQSALDRGDLEAAATAFRAVLKLDPQSAAARANLGVIAMRRKEWENALAEFHHAEKLAPAMSGVRLNIGIVEYRRGNYAAAIAPLQSVVKDQPGSLQANYLLGLCLSLVERYGEAVRVLEPLWPQMSSEFPYLYVLGNSAYHSGNAALDQKALQRLIEVGGDAPEFHLLMAKALLNRNDDLRALDELKKAAAGNPNLPFLHFNLGLVYQRAGQFELAEAEYRKNMQVEPDMPYSYEQLGKLYLQTGKLEEGEKLFREALQHEPRLPVTLTELAKIELRRGAFEGALRHIDAAEKLAPETQGVHFVRGQILQKLGREQEAAREFATARKLLAAGVEKDRSDLNKNANSNADSDSNAKRERIPEPEITQQP